MAEKNYKISKGTTLNHDQWIGPSIAVTCVLVTKIANELHFLTEKRGSGAPDFRGKLVFPCGFYDFADKYVRLGACRELMEETGIDIISPDDIHFAGVNDGLKTNNGNITLRYVTFVDETKISELTKAGKINTDSEKRGGEKKEVEKIQFVSYSWITKNRGKFAFHHDELADEVVANFDKIMEDKYYSDSWSKEKELRENK